MPINVNDVVRVVIRGKIHGQKTINVLHFKCAVAGEDAILLALVQALLQCIGPLKNKQSTEFSHEGVTATKLTGTFDEITDTSQSGTGVGIEDALPSFCAGVIRFHTAKQGRSGKGRMYIPGFSEGQTEDSEWDAPDIALGEFLLCLLDKFKLNGGTDPNWKLCVLSRKHLKTNPGDFNGATAFVVGGSVNQFVCTMRSRKIGHGD